MLALTIFNQRLSYFADSEVVADSKGFLPFTLETSDDWVGYIGKTVQFTRDGKTYNVTNVSDNVQYSVPWEVLKGAGVMYVNVFAVKPEGKRATTNQIAVEITESGFNENSVIPEAMTPDVFQQYVGIVESATNEVKGFADSASQSALKAESHKKQSEQFALQTSQDALNVSQSVNLVTQAVKDCQTAQTEVSNTAQNVYSASTQATQAANQAGASVEACKVIETTLTEYSNKAQLAEKNSKQSETNAKNSENIALKKSEICTQRAKEVKNDANTVAQDKLICNQKAQSCKNDADRAKGYADSIASGQVQADWNQQDGSQKSYIRNKPTVITNLVGSTNAELTITLSDGTSQTIIITDDSKANGQIVQQAINQLSHSKADTDKVPALNTEGHIVFPNGTELWVE